MDPVAARRGVRNAVVGLGLSEPPVQRIAGSELLVFQISDNESRLVDKRYKLVF